MIKNIIGSSLILGGFALIASSSLFIGIATFALGTYIIIK